MDFLIPYFMNYTEFILLSARENCINIFESVQCSQHKLLTSILNVYENRKMQRLVYKYVCSASSL